jgi:NitT/TauT family transport system ATP-binding protein|tara:strand:- start:864 stop:1646 length:783 start_codon:yes stop_codon:yes gene_type:complete
MVLDFTPSTATRPALALSQVSLAFDPDHRVLERVDLDIARGEFVTLVGPSGCGKSTVLRLMAGLLQPSSGRVELPDEPRIALVFQEPNLLPWRTVRENIALPLELLGVDPAETSRRVSQSVELIGFEAGDVQKRPRELSGGMRMRVSLARALVTEPDVLLLDEPFAALDDLLREQLNQELLAIHSARGTTAVFVTHNVAEAVFLSDRVVVMPPAAGGNFSEVAVGFPRPRTASLRAEADFAGLGGEVSARLRRGGREESS